MIGGKTSDTAYKFELLLGCCQARRTSFSWFVARPIGAGLASCPRMKLASSSVAKLLPAAMTAKNANLLSEDTKLVACLVLGLPVNMLHGESVGGKCRSLQARSDW